MVCVQVDVLTQPSVADQVRVITYSCGQPPAVVASVYVGVGAVWQLSVAVALPVLPGSVLAVHSIVTLAGHVIAGGVVSSIVMSCAHVLLLPHASVAVHTRVNSFEQLPSPGMSSYVMLVTTAVQASVAVAVPVAAGRMLSSHSTVTLPGHAMTGGVVSTMVITAVHVLVRPQASVAVNVTVWLPVAPQPSLKPFGL
jgi:hypothetical protein